MSLTSGGGTSTSWTKEDTDRSGWSATHAGDGKRLLAEIDLSSSRMQAGCARRSFLSLTHADGLRPILISSLGPYTELPAPNLHFTSIFYEGDDLCYVAIEHGVVSVANLKISNSTPTPMFCQLLFLKDGFLLSPPISLDVMRLTTVEHHLSHEYCAKSTLSA